MANQRFFYQDSVIFSRWTRGWKIIPLPYRPKFGRSLSHGCNWPGLKYDEFHSDSIKPQRGIT